MTDPLAHPVDQPPSATLPVPVASSRWRSLARRINAPFARLADRLSRPYFLRFDAGALWFYTLCFAAFVILSALGFHGSSIEIYSEAYHYSDAVDPALIGQYRTTRVDEWNFHTPAILNQVFREHPLAVKDAVDGPGKSALLANVPCRHFTQFFRPQFWAFHVLSAKTAFAIYWQAKALILLTGVFTLLLLLSGGASGLSAFGSLWFYFSAYTQWAYSWASLLPEMIGLFAWVMCLSFYLLAGRHPLGLLLAAVACAGGMIDFALCAYPPQQIPLITIGVFLTIWWVWSRADRIFSREGAGARLLALGVAGGIVAAVLAAFFMDAREVIAAAANTVYPGRRVCSGGAVSAEAYVDHFLDFWKTEDHFPPVLNNPSEGTGYLWLAPFTLLGLSRRRAALPRSTLIALLCCWGAFVFIGTWMTFPIPSWVGHWFFYDNVLANRCYHALGLVNVAIVVVALSRPRIAGPRRTVGEYLCRWLGLGIVAFSALSSINNEIANFYPVTVIASAALYAALLALCTMEHWKAALAGCVLLPSIIFTGQINPLQRHLHVFTKSALYEFVHQHPRLLRYQWIVYVDWVEQPGFFTALGIRNVNSLKVIPQVAALNLFDPEHQYTDIINQSGYVVTKSIPEDAPSTFESPSPGVVFWSVSPLDRRLKQIGVRFAAFAAQPEPGIAEKLKLLNPEPIGGMWLYELP